MPSGGKRKGAGRKSVRDEEKVPYLSKAAIIQVYGSEEEFFIKMAELSKESFKHMELLAKYAFGAPKQEIEMDNNIIHVRPINSD